jgi:DNA-binding beta-propeller fold protein YncE
MRIVISVLSLLMLLSNSRPGYALKLAPGPNLNILIADRGNNRIIEVTPDKRIVWEYHFQGLKFAHGADDAFFTPDNQRIVANLEEDNKIVVIDYATRRIVWEYGDGSKKMLGVPDDAYGLLDGNIVVAEIENCRVLVIAPDKHIVKAFGKYRDCRAKDGYFNHPNGATPLPNGHFLVTEIQGSMLTEIDGNGKIIYRMHVPLHYPSDAQPTVRGTIIVADYAAPGAIYEVDKQGHIVWQFTALNGQLRYPSLAAELPNGNIIANDDFNNRVVVIDKQTKKIVWQYGVTGKCSDKPGYLCIPDGLDWRNNAAHAQTLETDGQ